MSNNPHIGIEISEYFPADFENQLIEEISSDLLEVKISRIKPKIYASFEWAIPAIIAVYVSKPYFESFLKEAGKDHYNVLKTWIKNLLQKTKKMQSNNLDSGGIIRKETNTQSKTISIHFQTKNNKRIKLLFDNNMDLVIWQQSADNFLDLLQDHYNDKPNNELSQYLSKIDSASNTIVFAIIEPDTNNWILIDDISHYHKDKKGFIL